MSLTLLYFERQVSFLEHFLMILLDVLLFHMLYFILNYFAHAWLPTKTTMQAYINMATTKEMATYITTTRQRETKK